MSVDWSDLEGLGLKIRPISIWPGAATPESARLASPFKGTKREEEDGRVRYRQRKTPFTTTVKDLTRELDAINARKSELQLALRERDIRRDGFPRADAKPMHPGVVLAFNLPALKGQRITYAVDKFVTWQDNLRALALGLEALRKVKRFGMGSGWEQYQGYKAIPEVSSQTPEEARKVLLQLAGVDTTVSGRVEHNDVALFRRAAKAAQHAGEGELNAAMNAGRVLGVVT